MHPRTRIACAAVVLALVSFVSCEDTDCATPGSCPAIPQYQIDMMEKGTVVVLRLADGGCAENLMATPDKLYCMGMGPADAGMAAPPEGLIAFTITGPGKEGIGLIAPGGMGMADGGVRVLQVAEFGPTTAPAGIAMNAAQNRVYFTVSQPGMLLTIDPTKMSPLEALNQVGGDTDDLSGVELTADEQFLAVANLTANKVTLVKNTANNASAGTIAGPDVKQPTSIRYSSQAKAFAVGSGAGSATVPHSKVVLISYAGNGGAFDAGTAVSLQSGAMQGNRPAVVAWMNGSAAFYAGVTAGTGGAGANQVWYSNATGGGAVAIDNLPASALLVNSADSVLWVASGSKVKGYDIAGTKAMAPVMLTEIAVGPKAMGLAFDKSKKYLFVVCEGEGADQGAVYAINIASREIYAKYSGPKIVRPQAIAGAR